ncbi:MAG: ATP-binding protein [Colwellia sp.]|nr:ATP-binding protein [Colwellia sp.]MCW8866046.1 ATP-binding protein [Colwellia sp.]MCW9081254.1 ATP-binding protein [Colwellia sp.]
MRGLYVSIIFTVLGSLFFIGWGLDKLAESDPKNEQENQSTLVYRQLAQGLAKQLDKQTEESLSETVRLFQQQYKIKTQLVLSNDIALPEALLAQLTHESGLLLASKNDQYLLKKLLQHPQYLLQINFPLEQQENQPFNFLLTLALYLGICGILILWVFPLSRRLYLLNNAAAKIGAGQLNIRISPSRFSYIKMLEKSFNSMASQIEKLVADNKILARSLSHDIRTPIACLRFGLEAAIDSKTLEKKNSYLTRMDSELTNMEEMTSAFLEYASMERQALHLKKQQTDVNALVNSAINNCRPLAEQKQVSIKLISANPNINYLLDYHWCYRALVNLISNAIGYANNQVLINLTINNKQLTITIEDDGKGVASDKLDVIFTPFVKLDPNRSREQGHFGLGLAICAKVVDWHQGTITTMNNNRLSGACFTLSFPLKQ